MKKIWKFAILALCLAGAVLTLTACSSNAKSSDDDTSTLSNVSSGTPVAGLQQLNTKFNFNSVFVGNSHDLNHRRGYLALFFER